MAHSEERKEAIRLGVIKRYEALGRHTGEWVRRNLHCATCNAEFRPSRATQLYCSKKCRPKQTEQERKKAQVLAVTNRRKQLKRQAVEYKGGKCERCGYSKCIGAMEFHHTEPDKKDFSVSNGGHTRSWEAIRAEIEKCQLLCANCHREVHEEESGAIDC